jgi:hypothetical protein
VKVAIKNSVFNAIHFVWPYLAVIAFGTITARLLIAVLGSEHLTLIVIIVALLAGFSVIFLLQKLDRKF